jgi:hypothetical protein
VNRSLIWEAIKVLESCEAKLEYLGRIFSGPYFTDRHDDGPDCLHRAHKAKNIINSLKAEMDETAAHVPTDRRDDR